jgi:spore germination cell wall hydrolase CwlJ-like protein
MTEIEIKAALSDLAALAITLYGEGAILNAEGRIAIGSTVRNRVLAPRRFGHSFLRVCTHRSQFSCWWKWGGEQNHTRTMGLASAIVEGKLLPLEGRELNVWQECLILAEGIIAGSILDNVKGATHYYNPDAMVPRGRKPDWADDSKFTIAIGKRPHVHRFYKNV